MAFKIDAKDLKDSNIAAILRDNQTPEQFYRVVENVIKKDNLPIL